MRVLRLVSFDGGGARAFAQLEAMRAIMHQLRWEEHPDDLDKEMLPCEHFDIMGGSDVGGIVAIMFAKLRMTVEEVMDELGTIIDTVYSYGLEKVDRTTKLKGCIESLLSSRGVPLDLRLDGQGYGGPCAAFVVTALSMNAQDKVHFRTYRVPDEMPSNITVVEAALATCASPSQFAPASVGTGHKRRTYIGAGLGSNNPTRQVITEARTLFGSEANVSLILSLGSGHPGILPLTSDYGNDTFYQLVREMMADSEQEAQRLHSQLDRTGIYFRFSVEQGLQRTYIQGQDLSWISAQASAYISRTEIVGRVDEAVIKMKQKTGGIPLNRIDFIGDIAFASFEPRVSMIPPVFSDAPIGNTRSPENKEIRRLEEKDVMARNRQDRRGEVDLLEAPQVQNPISGKESREMSNPTQRPASAEESQFYRQNAALPSRMPTMALGPKGVDLDPERTRADDPPRRLYTLGQMIASNIKKAFYLPSRIWYGSGT